MSKVTRSKLKFLIYILLQETNKINRKFFQILNDFFRTHFSASRAFVTRKRFSALVGGTPNPHRTLPAASGCASVPDALTAVPASQDHRLSRWLVSAPIRGCYLLAPGRRTEGLPAAPHFQLPLKGHFSASSFRLSPKRGLLVCFDSLPPLQEVYFLFFFTGSPVNGSIHSTNDI